MSCSSVTMKKVCVSLLPNIYLTCDLKILHMESNQGFYRINQKRRKIRLKNEQAIEYNLETSRLFLLRRELVKMLGAKWRES